LAPDEQCARLETARAKPDIRARSTFDPDIG
jgi:hypothetical protein